MISRKRWTKTKQTKLQMIGGGGVNPLLDVNGTSKPKKILSAPISSPKALKQHPAPETIPRLSKGSQALLDPSWAAESLLILTRIDNIHACLALVTAIMTKTESIPHIALYEAQLLDLRTQYAQLMNRGPSARK